MNIYYNTANKILSSATKMKRVTQASCSKE